MISLLASRRSRNPKVAGSILTHRNGLLCAWRSALRCNYDSIARMQPDAATHAHHEHDPPERTRARDHQQRLWTKTQRRKHRQRSHNCNQHGKPRFGNYRKIPNTGKQRICPGPPILLNTCASTNVAAQTNASAKQNRNLDLKIGEAPQHSELVCSGPPEFRKPSAQRKSCNKTARRRA